MIEVKIDIVSDEDRTQRATMDTVCIIKRGGGDYMVYGDERSNPCFVKGLRESEGELELIKQALEGLIKSGNYCYINIIPESLEKCSL